MARLTKAAHERGILIGFDACHSVGAIPLRFMTGRRFRLLVQL